MAIDKAFRKIGAYTPSMYMRDRHPHLFSDSNVETDHSVTREVLSYHLETLTNQKQETAFEAFAHRMCEKFVAPNLRPQTGPTGGGDGKTDAETYPVSEEIALRWFVPEAPKARECFAFAFSAKKDWRTKVKSDVKSIVGTSRGYDHIFFVTNQFVPAKDSASVYVEAMMIEYAIQQPTSIEDRYGDTVLLLEFVLSLGWIGPVVTLDPVVDRKCALIAEEIFQHYGNVRECERSGKRTFILKHDGVPC